MKILLSDQGKAILDEVGTMLVLGGPGSGKTTISLVKSKQLIAHLEDEQEVLFLSFSRAAVRQVLIRCKDVLSSAERKRIAAKTYHAFCLELLRAHGRLLTGKQTQIAYPAPTSVRKRALGECWAAEEKRLADVEGVYTFDQFARSATRLLGEAEAVVELLASRYPVIILDEFQDTSDDQWALVQELAKRSRLLVLADPDQRIFDYDDRVNPARLNQLRTELSPATYDLGGENHRSPSGGILSFARAVLQNQPLPATSDVKLVDYTYQSQFPGLVHASVVWMFSELRKAGVESPSIVVLTRTNSLAAQVSEHLSESHTWAKRQLPPVEHDLMWDQDLTAAAAQVVASILEWPELTPGAGVAGTLDKIADYFELKNADKPTKTAVDKMKRYRACAELVRGGTILKTPKDPATIQKARGIGFQPTGDPARDWLQARSILDGPADFKQIFQNARAVRLFRATDEIGGRLQEKWDSSGTYGSASQIVRRAIEASMIIGEQRGPRGCVVMTLHKSKGKEFDGAILIEGRFNGQFFREDDERDKPLYQSARRLLMVGITRARHRVAIVRPQNAPPLVSHAAGTTGGQ